MIDMLWDQTLDEGTYRGRVERVSGYRGRLIVTRVADEEVLLDEEVGLAYGAKFGPDMDDVMDWQKKTIAAVDNQAVAE
jgi:hypothetical protein